MRAAGRDPNAALRRDDPGGAPGVDRHRAGLCVEQLMPLVRVGLDDISTRQTGGQGTDRQEWFLFHG